MYKIRIILGVISLFLLSCGDTIKEQQYYTWETDIEVKFSDNTKEVIKNKIVLHRESRPVFFIKSEAEGFFSNTKLTPCLIVTDENEFEVTNLACDVRTFKVIKQTKR